MIFIEIGRYGRESSEMLCVRGPYKCNSMGVEKSSIIAEVEANSIGVVKFTDRFQLMEQIQKIIDQEFGEE